MCQQFHLLQLFLDILVRRNFNVLFDYSNKKFFFADQLMSKTIQLKQPELEIQRKKLLQNEGQLWKQQLKLQDRLLEELSAAQGDILKNEVNCNF